MGTTKRTDLIYVDQLQEAITAAAAGITALNGTGAAVVSTTLPSIGPDGIALKGGDTVRVPYFDYVGELDDVAEGGALVPVKLAESSETATVVHSGKAGEITTWAQLTAMFSDPYAEYARQFVMAWARRIDKGLIDKAVASTLVNDISALVGPASQLSWDAIVDTQQLWADEQSDILLMVAHSYIYGQMRKLKTSTGLPYLQDPKGPNELPTFAGIPVRVSDRMTPTASVYPTAICKRAALAAWVNGTPTVETDRDILAATDVTAIHTFHVEHLYKRPPKAVPSTGGGTKTGVVILKSK